MTTHFRKLVVLVAALVAAFACSLPAHADLISVDEAYQQVKTAERGIPVPTPVQTVNVGTFDAAAGTFEARTLVDGVRTELAVFYDRVFGTIAFQDATQ